MQSLIHIAVFTSIFKLFRHITVFISIFNLKRHLAVLVSIFESLIHIAVEIVIYKCFMYRFFLKLKIRGVTVTSYLSAVFSNRREKGV